MGQNRQELFICISLCITKMLTISPYFWTSESPYFSFHRVNSPASVCGITARIYGAIF